MGQCSFGKKMQNGILFSINNQQDIREKKIVSGGEDSYIIFWHQYQDQWIIRQKLKPRGSILSLSFEDFGLRLASSVKENKNLVYTSNGMDWKLFKPNKKSTEQSSQQINFSTLHDRIYVYSIKDQRYRVNEAIKLEGSGSDILGFPKQLCGEKFQWLEHFNSNKKQFLQTQIKNTIWYLRNFVDVQATIIAIQSLGMKQLKSSRSGNG